MVAQGEHAKLPARAGSFRGGEDGLVSRGNEAFLADDGEAREAEGEAGAPIGLFLWVGEMGEQNGSFRAGTEGFRGGAEGFDLLRARRRRGRLRGAPGCGAFVRVSTGDGAGLEARRRRVW